MDGEPIWYGRGQDANGAKRTVFMSRRADHRLSRRLRAVGRAPPHGLSRRHHRERCAGAGPGSASRRTTTTSAPPASPACSAYLPDARFLDATGLVNWQRAIKSPTEIEYMRARRAHRRGDARAHPRAGRAGPAARTSWWPRSIARAIRGADGHGGDYPAIVPMLPSGIDASAPHLTWDDAAVQEGRGHLLRDRRLLPALPLPACRAPSISASRRRSSSTPRRRCVEGIAAALEAARPGSTCEERRGGLAPGDRRATASRRTSRMRLRDRPQLPARLGRAHDEPAARRHDGPRGRHDLPPHTGASGRRTGGSRSPRASS